MKKTILLTVIGFLFFFSTNAAIFTVTVNTDGVGAGTLRWAITQSNLTAAKDTIKFNAAFTITPASNYPVISFPLCIDGFSATGATQGALGTGTRVLKVILNGSGSSTIYGLQITASNCEIKGLVIQDFYKGILISGAAATNNWIWGNYIGTAANGLTATAATTCYDDGIALNTNTTNNIIGTNGDGSNDANEGNLISANGDGAQFFGESIAINEGGTISTDCSGNRIAGNYLGTNETGTASLYTTGLNTQRGSGVQINTSTLNIVGTNGDGVSDALERNIISGNSDAGIVIIGGGSNKIKGNYVGTTKTGLVGLPNYANGGTSILAVQISIKTASNNNIVGTDGDGVADNIEGNVIGSITFASASVNCYNYGMVVQACTGTRIAGNKIGIGADGTTVLNIKCTGSSYVDKCIYISSSSTSTVIGTNADGTSDALEANYFGNSGYGVTIDNSNSCTIAGNYFGLGTNLTTTETLATGGTYILNSTSTRVGSSASNNLERNYFCNNTLYGVFIDGNLTANNDLNNIRFNTFGKRPDGVGAPIGQNGILITRQSNADTIQYNYITKTGTGSAAGAYSAIQLGTVTASEQASGNVIYADTLYKNIGPAIAILNSSSQTNLISRNSIYNNGNGSDATGKLKLGIDLQNDGVTVDDNKDPDAGPNDLTNYPLVTSAIPGSSSCQQVVSGTYNGPTNTDITIELYSSDVCNGDTSGVDNYLTAGSNYGEGKTYLGNTTVHTSASTGSINWSITVPLGSISGKYLTSLAYQVNGTPTNSTSEFGPCYKAVYDCGDAPDSYHTLLINCGPTHENISSNLCLGTIPTSDNDGMPSAAANLDVDDGVASLPVVTTKSTSYILPVSVTNNSGTTATLYAWFDINQNGLFEASEFQTASVTSTGTQTINLTWNLSALTCGTTLNPGVTYIRLRLTTDALADVVGTSTVDERSYGLAADGEVEDYKIYIQGYDYGDLPNTYPTATMLCLEDTATAKVWAGVTKPGLECSQKYSVDATGDGSEEDGLTTSIGPSGASYNWVLKLNANQAAKTVYYGLWLDWDGNQNFTSGLDAFYSGSAVVTGATNKNISVYSPYGISNSAFRVIVSDAPLTSGMYNATITNGEIEDYFLLKILASPGNVLMGTKQTTGNVLKWKNTSALAITNYTVEKSNDNLSWTTLGFVIPTSSNASIQYSYSDLHPGKENYYRLKFSLADSTFQYSNIVPLFDKNNLQPVIIYPNPATNTLTIQNTSSNYNKFKVLDLTGRMEISKELNSVNTVVDISNLAPGTHIIKFITKDDEEDVQRFVKIK